ncbi:MAG: PTS sugar transporter subunit IIB [Anaerolineae bacterium]|nr:PTS sugar transporter subunit IIB [Anaerolineae bacterium]
MIAVWCKHKPFKRIVIIDDQLAQDPYMQEVMRLAAPPGLVVEVYSVDAAIQTLSQETQNRSTTMLLMRSPQVARRLYEGGLTYSALNVGGIGSGPGRRNIFKNIAASDEEIAIMKDLMDRGVRITLLTVPGEKSKEFADLYAELKRK